MASAGQNLGVDLDLLDFPVASHGEPVAHAGHMDSRAQRLKR
jgi:hypothetical protein